MLGLIDYNLAKLGVPNPARRAKEKRPFETWVQIEAVAAQLGPVYGPMVVFAAATGLRPSKQREAAGVDHGQASGDKRDRERDRVHPAALSASRSHCSSGSPVMPESVR